MGVDGVGILNWYYGIPWRLGEQIRRSRIAAELTFTSPALLKESLNC